jgi:hypothetical protein
VVFDVDLINTIPDNFSGDPFKRLNIPGRHKKLIASITSKRTNFKYSKDTNGPWKADFILWKGTSQVILLHGRFSTLLSRFIQANISKVLLEQARHIQLVVCLQEKWNSQELTCLECVATSTRRPLLRLPAADIVIEQSQMEAKLTTWFRLADRWDAILLVEEADILMQAREISDFGRSSQVASRSLNCTAI